jgi:hypothetical protein
VHSYIEPFEVETFLNAVRGIVGMTSFAVVLIGDILNDEVIGKMNFSFLI